METGNASEIFAAQCCFAAAAALLGFETILHEPPLPTVLEDPCTPQQIFERVEEMGDAFLHSQPNLLLRLGPPRDISQTLMFNFHMDTVADTISVNSMQGKIRGRGAADAKGPGVALLAGIQGSLERDPALSEKITILIQCVSGEEGGAMGVYGTRALVNEGFIGKLNIFAEASDGCFFDHSTASMTARIRVKGAGSTDDEPQMGDNATLLLGFLSSYLGEHLANDIHAKGGKLCIAGINTGKMHNCIYGSGDLLLNFAYASSELGRYIGASTEKVFAAGCAAFRSTFHTNVIAQKTVADLPTICTLTWLKQGLPVLANRNSDLESFLEHCGLQRNPDDCAERAFTCDAIWVQHPDTYTIVYGPGALGNNGAHTRYEFIAVTDLENYAQSIVAIVSGFSTFSYPV